MEDLLPEPLTIALRASRLDIGEHIAFQFRDLWNVLPEHCTNTTKKHIPLYFSYRSRFGWIIVAKMKARHLANLVSKGKAGRLVHRSQQVLAEQLLGGNSPAVGEDARTGEFRIDYHSGRPLVIDKKGYDLIHDPWFNKVS